MQIHSINNGYQAQQLTKRCSKPAFTSKYEIEQFHQEIKFLHLER